AGGEEQIARHFVRLDAVDGLLDFGLEVLNAHTEAIEAEFAESLEMLAGGHARVNFDANLTVGVEVEMFSGECEQILDLFRSQIACIARAGTIVFCEEILADTELAPHLIEAGMCECHA